MRCASSIGIVAVAVAGIAGCGDASETTERETQDPPPPRRVIEPPTGTVRLLPPYAITQTEVGPYKLGMKLASLLDKLPAGPRSVRFEIPDVVHTGLIRAEDGMLLIGTEPSPSFSSSSTTFVGVLGPDVARADQGIHVGSKLAELEKLGPLSDELDRARDPRLIVPATMRNTRFVMERGRVAAVVIGGLPAVLAPEPPSTCPRPPAKNDWIGVCLTGVGEYLEIDDDWIVVRSTETERTLGTIRVPNLAFAVPLRNAAFDGRDELVAVARTDESQQRTWSIVVFRIDAKRHVVVVDPKPLYALSSAQARWIGADLEEIDLYLEMSARPDGIEVGGLLTTRSSDRLRDLVVISPVTVTRRLPPAGKPAPEPSDAGVPDSDPSSRADPAKL